MMNERTPLTLAATLFGLAFVFGADVRAQDATGIKAANIRGADLKLMENHDPEVERAHFDLLDGYEVNLFAAEPMLANPVHMMWDARGRLWVACSWSYPQIKPGEKADDKIIILEDTDGDGQADKSTVFADGLYLPTGIELANGGCYVAQSPDVFFFKDTDGDDVADVKQLALTGFGIEDNHHSISAWRRGPGGWLYFQEGIFLHTQVETQYGVVRNYNGGVYQFNPRTQELRTFATGTGGNPWGHVFNRWGQSFMVNNPRILHLSPASGNSDQPIALKHLLSTDKQCGGDLATGTHIGDDLRGQLLTGRFKSRAVVRYEFLEKGSSYSASVLKPLISSRHPNFRPVDAKMGPDGAVYVADWYNSIINHAQHDFRDPRRDHDHGRVWRITRKGAPLVEPPLIHGAPIEELVPHLASEEDWVRHQVRGELAVRDPDTALKALENWAGERERDDHALVEAMWACQNIGRVSENIFQKVVAAEDGNARSTAARILRYWHRDLADPIAALKKLASDPHPRTRMEAILSAGYFADAEALPAILAATDHPTDSNISAILPQTIDTLSRYWQPALESGELAFTKPEHRAYLEKFGGLGFGKQFSRFLKTRKPSDSEVKSIATQFAAEADNAQVVQAVKAIGDRRLDRKTKVALLGAIEAVGRRVSDPSWRTVAVLWKQLGSPDDEVAIGAAGALGAWKVKRVIKNLSGVLQDEKRSSEVRTACAVALGELEDPKAREILKKMSQSDGTIPRYIALIGLAHADLTGAAPVIAKTLQSDPEKADPAALVSAVLQRKGGGRILLAAIGDEPLHPKVAEQLRAYHRRTGHLPKQIVGILAEEKGTTMSERLLKENQERLVADVEKLGDPVRGEKIYRRPAMACMGCHAIGPAGPEIGPNLVAVGGAATTEYMIESILSPNAAIAEHYENVVITLEDGSIRSGVVSRHSDKETTIRDAALGGQEVTLPAAQILRKQTIPSLMPAGLADQLTNRQEFLDLTKFLSVLGRPGPFANDESPVIRLWEWKAAEKKEAALPEKDGGWQTSYSLVSGALPLNELAGEAVWVRGFLDVEVAGRVILKVENPIGLKLWIDGRPADLAQATDLKKGRHQYLFLVDREARREGPRVEFEAASNSPVKFSPVTRP